ncbi:MAG TPA: hypothetical protein VJ965_02250, partial [Anaerolineales bacterium]|nr:hypothetical protein [Anaerolineales bacterium]
SEDIVIYISLSGLEPGSYLINPGFDVLVEGVEITSINPDTIEVVISDSEDTGSVGSDVEATPTSTIEPTPTENP